VALPDAIPLDPAAEEDTAQEEFDAEEFDAEEFDAEEFDESPDDPHAARTIRPAVSIDAVIAVERSMGFLSSVVLPVSSAAHNRLHLEGSPTLECDSMIDAQQRSRRLMATTALANHPFGRMAFVPSPNHSLQRSSSPIPEQETRVRT